MQEYTLDIAFSVVVFRFFAIAFESCCFSASFYLG